MADTATRFVLPTLTGQTGLTLSVFALDGDTVLNSGGDTLTETAQANGVFDATVHGITRRSLPLHHQRRR